MLKCLIDHVLPVAGHHVQTLDLAHGKAVTNEIVSQSAKVELHLQAISKCFYNALLVWNQQVQ